MLVPNTYTGVAVAMPSGRTNDGRENTVHAQGSADPARRVAHELRVAGEPLPVDEFVAGVLDRAHHAAYAHAAPDEARAILNLAQLFADELAKVDPRFDRLRFIRAATEEPS